MNERPYLIVTACIFGIVGALHLVRLALHFDLIMGPWSAPMWISIIGTVVPGALCWWGLQLAKGARKAG